MSFFTCPLAGRMAAAEARGDLFREKPFVMDYEGALMQGIIDVFWMEGDKIVLRGKGKTVLTEIKGTSKKGKLKIEYKKYI